VTAEPAPSVSPSAARRFGALVWHEHRAVAACQRFCADRTDPNALAAVVALEALRKARGAA